MTERFLTPADMAERYQISDKSVEHRRARGQFPPAVKIGRLLRWRLADVEKWEARQTERAAS